MKLKVAGTHSRHVLHENSEGLLIVVPQTAVVLNNALVMQIFQQLDFALQSADLLYRHNEKQGKGHMTTQTSNIKAVIPEQCIFGDLLFSFVNRMHFPDMMEPCRLCHICYH